LPPFVIDPDPCLTGWGPCPHIATGGHAGRRQCCRCGATHTPPNADRAQLAALGATPPDAITVTVRRPEPAAGHFTD